MAIDDDLRSALHYDPATGFITYAYDYRPKFNSQRRRWKGDRAETSKAHGYLVVCIFGKPILAHRLAWFLHTGAWPTDCIDHKNLDRSDNRIENLRESTRGQNMSNKRGSSKKGLPKGVQKDSPNRYRAQISCYGRTCRIGTFKTVEEAHEAYCEVALWVHGEFARVA